MKKHRYNPDQFIPASVLDKIPNWEYALDEEGEDGQDESTIKPAAIQDSVMPHHTCLTVGDAKFTDGSTAVVLIDFGYVWDGNARSIEHFRLFDPALKKMLWVDARRGGVVRTPEFYEHHGHRLPMYVTSRLNGPDGEQLKYRLFVDDDPPDPSPRARKRKTKGRKAT